jgi:hypothetical protein
MGLACFLRETVKQAGRVSYSETGGRRTENFTSNTALSSRAAAEKHFPSQLPRADNIPPSSIF